MISLQRIGKLAATFCFTAAMAVSAQVAGADAPVLNKGGIDQDGGVIKGIVKFDGRQAPRRPVRMDADRVCSAAGEALSEMFVFGDNDTLQNVLVYVSSGLSGSFEAPAQAHVLDQKGCVYIPHVSAAVVNQQIDILNSDPTLHNVNVQARTNRGFNEGMPVQGMRLEKRFNRPEMALSFKCDVHPWMQAYLHVMEHPFFAVTQQDGTFEIRGLPAGTYEVKVRHEFNRFAPREETISVTVAEGETQEVAFTYAPRGN